MPAGSPPRRVTLNKVPFDFYRSRSSVTCYSQAGEYLMPADAANEAVAKGYATEGWAKDSTTRTNKGGPRRKKATSPRKPATPRGDAATDMGSDAGMGGTPVAKAHRAVTGQRPAPAAK